MRRERLLIALLVPALWTAAVAEDVVAQSRETIAERISAITPPQGGKEKRELRFLERAEAWLAAYDYAPDTDSAAALYKAIRDARKARSQDSGVDDAVHALSSLIEGMAGARLDEAEVCEDAIVEGKVKRRLGKSNRKAQKLIDKGERVRHRNETQAGKFWFKATRSCVHGIEAGQGEPIAAGAPTLAVVSLGDTHNHLSATGPRAADLLPTQGGIARAATLIGELRETRTDTLVLHAGDTFQGDVLFNLTLGVPELQLLYQLGFDAMAVGNHDVGYGPELLAYALSEADGQVPPLLTANVDLSEFDVLENWIGPSLTKDVNGTTVGIFGLTAFDDLTAMPEPLVILPNVQEIAAQQAAALDDADARIVIAISHLNNADNIALAKSVPGIDIIVGGHDHYELAAPLAIVGPDGRTTRLVNAGKHYEHVSYLEVVAGDHAAVQLRGELQDTDASVVPAPPIAAAVAGLEAYADSLFDGVYDTDVAVASAAFPRETAETEFALGRRDAPAGDLVCDAYRAVTGTDIALTPRALISEGLKSGHIVPMDLFRVVSYGLDLDTGMGLQLVTMTMDGANLATSLETTIVLSQASDDYALECSGMTYAYDSSQAPGSMLQGALIGGEPLDLGGEYTVTMNAGTFMLLPLFGIEVSDVEMLDTFEFEALMGYALAVGDLAPEAEYRAQDLR